MVKSDKFTGLIKSDNHTSDFFMWLFFVLHLSFSFLLLLVSSIHRQEKTLVARSIVQRMIDNQKRSGAAIARFESC
jgi:hypothetical protein